jgi:mono/diheme cytochrome c family protein
MRFLMMSLVSLGVVAACGARAQQSIGDPEAGSLVASEFCAGCHAISVEQGMSPILQAPRFEDVANTTGTAMGLLTWLTTSHPPMPTIALEPEELRNIVAYILSLKDQP